MPRQRQPAGEAVERERHTHGQREWVRRLSDPNAMPTHQHLSLFFFFLLLVSLFIATKQRDLKEGEGEEEEDRDAPMLFLNIFFQNFPSLFICRKLFG